MVRVYAGGLTVQLLHFEITWPKAARSDLEVKGENLVIYNLNICPHTSHSCTLTIFLKCTVNVLDLVFCYLIL